MSHELLVLCRELMHASPYPMAVFQGPEHILRYANPAFWRLAGQQEEFILGKAVGTCLPQCPGCIALLARVSASRRAEQHTEEGYSEAWSYSAWPLSSNTEASSLTMLQVTETSALHRQATMMNQALLVSALEQDEIMEATQARAEELGTDIIRKDQELDRTKEELRQLASRLLEAQEEERRRIARELHDSFAQQLALLSIQVDLLTPEVSTGAGLDSVAKIQGQLAGLANDARTLSHTLHPPALEDLGLVAGLRALQAEFETNLSLAIQFRPGDVRSPIPLPTATALYRIVQESLWNIAKHAGADAFVTLQLAEQHNRLVLTIEDTGIGFDLEQARRKGALGMISMQERARLAGGHLTIASAPGRGTTLTIYVPLEVAARPSRLS